MIELTISIAGYTVTTRSDSNYFTAYKEGTLAIAGTISRPHRGDRHWCAYDIEGSYLGYGIGPRTALVLFSRRDRRAA